MLLNIVLCQWKQQLAIAANSSVGDLFTTLRNQSSSDSQNINDSAFFVICNGKKLQTDSVLENGKTYHFVPRLLGGKGGFGSMLRAIGAQIEKTTSREACRDLSGRRMRDINNEKKLKEWLAKEAEREQEREERKKDRLARHLKPQHKFDDAEYHEQNVKVQEDLQDALSTGLKRKATNGGKAEQSQQKKSKLEAKGSKGEWLGVDLDSDDMDSSDSDNDMEANPGDPGSSPSQEDVNGPSSSGRLSSSQLKGEMPDHSDTVKKEESLSSTSSPEDKNGDEHNHPINSTESISKEDRAEPEIPSDTPVELEEFGSSLELQALGLDRLKHALMSRNLKCGGTLEERAARLFLVKGLSPEDIKASHPTLLAKPSGKGGKGKKSK